MAASVAAEGGADSGSGVRSGGVGGTGAAAATAAFAASAASHCHCSCPTPAPLRLSHVAPHNAHISECHSDGDVLLCHCSCTEAGAVRSSADPCCAVACLALQPVAAVAVADPPAATRALPLRTHLLALVSSPSLPRRVSAADPGRVAECSGERTNRLLCCQTKKQRDELARRNGVQKFISLFCHQQISAVDECSCSWIRWRRLLIQPHATRSAHHDRLCCRAASTAAARPLQPLSPRLPPPLMLPARRLGAALARTRTAIATPHIATAAAVATSQRTHIRSQIRPIAAACSGQSKSIAERRLLHLTACVATAGAKPIE